MLNYGWKQHGREHFLAACKSGVLCVCVCVCARARACASSCRNLKTVTSHCSHRCLENAVGNLWTRFMLCIMLPGAASPADIVYNKMECSAWIVMTCYGLSCFALPWDPGRKNCLWIQYCAPRSCTGHMFGQVWFESCLPFLQRISPSAIATRRRSLAPGSHMVELLTPYPLTQHGSHLSSFDIRFNVTGITCKPCDFAEYCQVLWCALTMGLCAPGWQRSDV
jgi:hypothetical protein